MEKKDLLKKQELAEELGMRFDEVSELFSEETLDTMKMMNTAGGTDDGGNNVTQCGCTVYAVNCPQEGGSCKGDDKSKNNGSNCGIGKGTEETPTPSLPDPSSPTTPSESETTPPPTKPTVPSTT